MVHIAHLLICMLAAASASASTANKRQANPPAEGTDPDPERYSSCAIEGDKG